MPLPSPILDDRSAEQLFDELARRLPIYAPEWTDQLPGDPGIALLELFAYMGQGLLARLNQVPDDTRLAFLRLLDVPLRPAQPAAALIALSSQAGALQVEVGDEARAGNVPFEVEQPVQVWPLSVLALAKAPSPLPEDDERKTRLERLAQEAPVAFYVPRVLSGLPGAPGAAPVDFGDTVDGSVWIAVLGDAAKVGSLGDSRPPVLSLGFLLDDPGGVSSAGRPGVPPALQWEISCLGAVAQADLDQGRPLYQRLRVIGDGTQGLTRPGVVQLQLPQLWDWREPRALQVDAEDLRGVGELPPAIEDEKQAAQVLFWLRGRRQDGGGLPALTFVGINATTVLQCRTAGAEQLGTGSGQPRQQFALLHRPVLPGTLVIEVQEGTGWRRWREVDSFAGSGEDDRHFVIDAEAGLVRFGDGLRGRAPQAGARVRTPSYRYGGGAEGNVPPGAISKVLLRRGGSVPAQNPVRAAGGAPAEALDQALERVPQVLRHRDRAVTAEDFRALALATPGVSVGRAECLPLFHPSYPGSDTAGVVSVMVWPGDDPRDPQAPQADPTLLRAVTRWLDERRLVSTELHVLPPRYRRVALSVGVHTKATASSQMVQGWVEQILRQYLMPLPPYGPSGQGWPLGRRVYGPELEAVVMQVEGVEYVEGLWLAQWNDDLGLWLEGPVPLRRDEVPQLAEIQVVEGPPRRPQMSSEAEVQGALAELAAVQERQAEELRALEAQCGAERAELLRRQADELARLKRPGGALFPAPPPARKPVAIPKLKEEC